MRPASVALLLLVSNHCSASSDTLELTLSWLQNLAPQNIEFTMLKSAIKFMGCKQKEYMAALNQPLTEHVVLEMGLGYAKGNSLLGSVQSKDIRERVFLYTSISI
jgi:hypothetical protein